VASGQCRKELQVLNTL
jgi:hypothetical protein